MKILIVGEVYSQNLGDSVICETVRNLVEEQLGETADVISFDLSGKISYEAFSDFADLRSIVTFVKMMFRIPLFVKNSPMFENCLKTFVRLLRSLSVFDKILVKEDIDLIVFAGGSMFMDFFADSIYYIVKEASDRKIPVIFHACGISELSERSVRLFKKAFSSKCVRSISLRDGEKSFRKMFGENILFEKTNDTALCCSKYYVATSEKIADIGIGVIDLLQHRDLQKQIIETLLKTQCSWKIFSNGSPYDQIAAEQILTQLNIDPMHFSDYLCDRPTTPEELVKTITGFKKIISFRMHSQIISSSFNIDSYGIIWNEKVRDFYENIGLPQRSFYPSEILEAIPSIISDKESTVLKSNVSVCAEESKNNLFDKISVVLKDKQ